MNEVPKTVNELLNSIESAITDISARIEERINVIDPEEFTALYNSRKDLRTALNIILLYK